MNVRPFVQLDNLNPALDHQKIRVCIIRLWKSFKSLQMVFVDSDGTRIHASIEDGLVSRFQNQLAVGESEIVDTFSLVDYDSSYNTSSLGFKIVFYRTTVVKPCDEFPVRVPKKYFQAITIENLKSGKSAYVVEKFWEKEDMVVQFGKELYGRNELSNNSLDLDDHKLQIAPAEMNLTSSKRDHTDSNVGTTGGHSMMTRKKIKN
ncbi:PREDICTED: uncharacterized protein LOC104733371 [Camelina sativa]|uniref:Uncharacterized protein LOC104733371 n=1 Tax=Camelina sativa TaxID=90675 RepID=A0ABM0V5U6_CAMSA|nr:PREDICTED: uncharacterized protein LOC104733371 [Camelina sativa]